MIFILISQTINNELLTAVSPNVLNARKLTSNFQIKPFPRRFYGGNVALELTLFSAMTKKWNKGVNFAIFASHLQL